MCTSVQGVHAEMRSPGEHELASARSTDGPAVSGRPPVPTRYWWKRNCCDVARKRLSRDWPGKMSDLYFHGIKLLGLHVPFPSLSRWKNPIFLPQSPDEGHAQSLFRVTAPSRPDRASLALWPAAVHCRWGPMTMGHAAAHTHLAMETTGECGRSKRAGVR